MPSRPGDHGGVVGVQARARDRHAPEARQPLRRELGERAAARHAAAQYGGAIAGGPNRTLQLGHQHVQHGVLKRAGQVRAVALQIIACAHGVEYRGLETGKRELEPLVPHGTREREARRISPGRQPLDGGAPGISQPEQRRHLVERLARGIVAGRAEQAIAAPGRDVEQHRMAARDEQRDERRGELGILDRGREQVSLHVMHADQPALTSVGEGLRVDDTHEERAHETRPLRHGHGIHRAPREASLREGAIDHRRQRGQMRPAGELRDDATEHAVDVL